jgi:hypothetical protein
MHRDGFHWVGIWDTAATRISSCGVAGLRGESPSSRDPVPSSRRPSPAHTVLSGKHSSDLQRTPSRGRKATRRRGRQRLSSLLLGWDRPCSEIRECSWLDRLVAADLNRTTDRSFWSPDCLFQIARIFPEFHRFIVWIRIMPEIEPNTLLVFR